MNTPDSKVSCPLGGATHKTLIGRSFTNFKDMNMIESALESWNIIFSKFEKICFGFRPIFVTQNGIYKPHDAHLSNFTQKGRTIHGIWFSGNIHVCSWLNFEYMFTTGRINFESLSRVEQVENPKTNSSLLNFTRIN